jgi:hypothetical protein
VEALWKHAGATRNVAKRQQHAQLVDGALRRIEVSQRPLLNYRFEHPFTATA